jgi:hypothetical protein
MRCWERRSFPLVNARWARVTIEHTLRAVTTVVNGTVLNTEDGERVRLRFGSQFGTGFDVTVGTNQLDDATLHRVIARAEAMAPPHAPAADAEPDEPDDWQNFVNNKQEYLPVSLWHDTTIRAMDTVRGDVIPQLVER